MTLSINWQSAHAYTDILFETAEGIAKITINRPERRNAFRPETVNELIDAFHRAHRDNSIGAIILTGAGHEAFCSGGDQKVRGAEGYIDEGGTPHLNVLDLQMQIRRLPKPAASTTPPRRSTGGWSTPSCRPRNSRKKPSTGAATCSSCRPWRCA